MGKLCTILLAIDTVRSRIGDKPRVTYAGQRFGTRRPENQTRRATLRRNWLSNGDTYRVCRGIGWAAERKENSKGLETVEALVQPH
jgi:hypothetical protein